MAKLRDEVLHVLSQITLPWGGTLGEADVIRALSVDEGQVRFVIEVPNADQARQFAPIEAKAHEMLLKLAGIEQVNIVTTAPAAKAPSLKIGRHPTAQQGPQKVPGVAKVIAVGSGKGGVGKSTLTTNLAVALARAGKRVGVLDADIYGPSQPRMFGLSGRPASPDGKIIEPFQAYGITVMSLGFMIKDAEAVIWRGPMLMGAIQQMLQQVRWGELDVLLVDLPPGTGDVQLSLCQKTELAGVIIVSTPQDVALIDARRAIDMFNRLETPILGLVENMSTYICPNCGHEAHLFGHGGVATEAAKIDMPFLGEIPLDLNVRLSGDAGTPIAAGEGPIADAYAGLARRLISQGMV